MHPVFATLLMATLCIGVAVGSRLLLLFRKTRGIPELALGAASLCTCLAALCRAAEVSVGSSLSAGVLLALQIGFAVLFASTPVCVALGTWRVFRPGERWAALLTLTLCGLIAVGVALRWLVPALAPIDSWRGLSLVFLYLVVSVWTCIEAFLCFAKLRKRMRIGLGDAVTTSQFLFWGIATAANGLNRVLVLVTLSSTGVEPLRVPAFVGITSLLGLLTVGCLYLAFFPPLRLQDFLIAQAAREER